MTTRIQKSTLQNGHCQGQKVEMEELFVHIIADDEEREAKPTIGYYAMFELCNGFIKTLYWSKKKMLVHADKYSKAFSLNGTGGKYPKVSYADYEAGKVPESELWKYSSFWYKDFDAMAKKTVLRNMLSKWGILSIEMQNAYTADTNIVKEDIIDDPDNVQGNIEDENIIDAAFSEDSNNFEGTPLE